LINFIVHRVKSNKYHTLTIKFEFVHAGTHIDYSCFNHCILFLIPVPWYILKYECILLPNYHYIVNIKLKCQLNIVNEKINTSYILFSWINLISILCSVLYFSENYSYCYEFPPRHTMKLLNYIFILYENPLHYSKNLDFIIRLNKIYNQ